MQKPYYIYLKNTQIYIEKNNKRARKSKLDREKTKKKQTFKITIL